MTIVTLQDTDILLEFKDAQNSTPSHFIHNAMLEKSNERLVVREVALTVLARHNIAWMEDLSVRV